MAIDRAVFDDITEADLAELVSAGTPEGLRLEYKRTTYGNADGDKREALKDISSFANTQGGHLLIGIEEAKGIPTALLGLGTVNVDQEILRLEQLVRSGIEPRILGVRTRAVPLAAGGHCLVMRIPRSWHLPHRVSAGGHNKFYLRNSGGVHEAGVEELRTMFTQGAEVEERAWAFRDKRVAAIDVQRTGRRLVAEGRAILHILSLAGLMGQVQVDLDEAAKRWNHLPALGQVGSDFRINLDGLFVERGGERLHGYAQLFRNGGTEAVRAGLWRDDRGKQIVFARTIEEDVALTVPPHLAFLQALGVPPPFVVMLTLEGMANTTIRAITPMWSSDPEPGHYEAIARLPEVIISEFGTDADYQRALRPIIDALWNLGGRPRALTYDDMGKLEPDVGAG
jgi:hypothetical protein